MMTFTLYWGVYPQWTKKFATCKEAVFAARNYAEERDAPFKEFRLIQLVEWPLE